MISNVAPSKIRLTYEDVVAAHSRIASYLVETPVFSSALINKTFGHEFFFKAENLQRVGAFKARGAMNTLLWATEQGLLAKQVVAVSSGNHAQAVAWAAKVLGVSSKIFMPSNVSKIKVQATRAYGAEVVLTADRQSAEREAEREKETGCLFVPPYDHDQVICGQGTACLEASWQVPALDAVVVPVGGGGLVSGTWLAAQGRNIPAVLGVEPSVANDATRSVRSGRIHAFSSSPPTICDGVRTLSISERTFFYLKQIAGMIEVSEGAVVVATQWLTHLLKLTVEPTAALSFAGAVKWAVAQPMPRRILVLLTGGNMDHETRSKIYAEDYLEKGLDGLVSSLNI